MGFTFERFIDTGGRFSPRVSIRAQGAFGISQGALRHFGLLDGIWYVVLFYDKTANVIGIQPTRDSTEKGAIKLVVRKYKPSEGNESYSSSISGKSFLEYYGIPYSKSRSYMAEKDPETGFIIVKLSSPEEDEAPDEPVQTDDAEDFI